MFICIFVYGYIHIHMYLYIYVYGIHIVYTYSLLHHTTSLQYIHIFVYAYIHTHTYMYVYVYGIPIVYIYIIPGMGFPVRTKGTGNTEHMFSQWGLVGTGNREQGTSHETFAGPPEDKLKFIFGGGESLREQGTGNREQGTGNMPCSPSVPGTCSGTTPGKSIPGKPIPECLVFFEF